MEIASLVVCSLTLLVTIAGILVAVCIYKKQQKFELQLEIMRKQDRKQEEVQQLKDWQKAKSVAKQHPFYGFGDCKQELEDDAFLRIRANCWNETK